MAGEDKERKTWIGLERIKSGVIFVILYVAKAHHMATPAKALNRRTVICI